jgi:hypothetical protein
MFGVKAALRPGFVTLILPFNSGFFSANAREELLFKHKSVS